MKTNIINLFFLFFYSIFLSIWSNSQRLSLNKFTTIFLMKIIALLIQTCSTSSKLVTSEFTVKIESFQNICFFYKIQLHIHCWANCPKNPYLAGPLFFSIQPSESPSISTNDQYSFKLRSIVHVNLVYRISLHQKNDVYFFSQDKQPIQGQNQYNITINIHY